MRTTRTALLMVGLLTCTVVLVWLPKGSLDRRITQLEADRAELRSRIEVLDLGDDGLGGRDKRSQHLRSSDSMSEPATVGSTTSQFEGELIARLTALAVVQSNTLVLLERLSAQIPHVESAAELSKRRAENLPLLETAVAENQRLVETYRLRAAGLLESLQIPDNISIIHPDVALNTLSLKPYWAFFEAKRERDRAQELADKFQLRLSAERIEAAASR